MDKLIELYQKEVFCCKKCNKNTKQIKFINPYRDNNPKIRTEKEDYYKNRTSYLLDYLKEKRNIQVMIIGLAPGLDGCGYSGIPFTSEHNAIVDLCFTNYHGSNKPYQTEESANVIYSVLARVAMGKGVSVKELSKVIYMTNSCLCVPLKDSGDSIDDPSGEMLENCWPFLRHQINLINPKTIIVLGSTPYKQLFINYGGYKLKDIEKLTKCIEKGSTFTIRNRKILPELHPSKRNRNNPNTKHLYPLLTTRLENLINNSIDL